MYHLVKLPLVKLTSTSDIKPKFMTMLALSTSLVLAGCANQDTSFGNSKKQSSKDAESELALAQADCVPCTGSGCTILNKACGGTIIPKDWKKPKKPGKPHDTCAKIEQSVAPSSGNETLICSSMKVTDNTIASIVNSPILTRVNHFYPGNVIQGKQFADQNDPTVSNYDIARAGGTITVAGVNQPGNFSKTVAAPSPASTSLFTQVDEARRNLVIGKIKDPSAEIKFSFQQVFNSQDLALTLNVAGSYGAVKASDKFKFSKKDAASNLLVSYFQPYYSVIFEQPANPYDFFQGGVNFKDPQGLISADNPPLYISEVQYGRAAYVLIQSDYDATTVKNVIQGSYHAPSDSISANSSITYGDVAQSFNVEAVVLGGGAQAGQNLTSELMTGDRIAAIQKFLKSPPSGSVDAADPISFTMNYVLGNKEAAAGSVANYESKNCSLSGDFIYNYFVTILNEDGQLESPPRQFSHAKLWGWLYDGATSKFNRRTNDRPFIGTQYPQTSLIDNSSVAQYLLDTIDPSQPPPVGIPADGTIYFESSVQGSGDAIGRHPKARVKINIGNAANGNDYSKSVPVCVPGPAEGQGLTAEWLLGGRSNTVHGWTGDMRVSVNPFNGKVGSAQLDGGSSVLDGQQCTLNLPGPPPPQDCSHAPAREQELNWQPK